MAYRTKRSLHPLKNQIKSFRLTDEAAVKLKEMTEFFNENSDQYHSESDTIIELINLHYNIFKFTTSQVS